LRWWEISDRDHRRLGIILNAAALVAGALSISGVTVGGFWLGLVMLICGVLMIPGTVRLFRTR
jgi:hypothetical protein